MPSFTSKTKAERFLRKYSASSDTPVYAAAIDAQTCVLSLCDVPWERTSAHGEAFPSHDADSLDDNVALRDSFDAALFCAGHSGGKHRAYANACCYRFRVPDAGIGATLEEISFSAASDPYNAAGLRINVFTNSTGVIPMDCHVLRGENAAGEILNPARTAQGAVPRTSQTAEDGTEFWYAASGTVSLAPNLVLDKYLFVLVALENYNTSRGNWLEGSGFARNSFSLTTDTEIDWSLTEPEPSGSFLAFDGSPDSLPPIPPGAASGRRSVSVPLSAGGLNAAYHAFLAPATDAQPANAGADGHDVPPNASIDARAVHGQSVELGPSSAPGAMFNIRRAPVRINGRAVDSWSIASSVLCVPLAMPSSFRPSALSVSVPAFQGDHGASFRVWIAAAWMDSIDPAILLSPALYDARADAIDDSPLRLAGAFSSQGSFSFPLSQDEAAARFLTVVISAFIPPDALDQSSSAWQGSQAEVFPSISFS